MCFLTNPTTKAITFQSKLKFTSNNPEIICVKKGNMATQSDLCCSATPGRPSATKGTPNANTNIRWWQKHWPRWWTWAETNDCGDDMTEQADKTREKKTGHNRTIQMIEQIYEIPNALKSWTALLSWAASSCCEISLKIYRERKMQAGDTATS